MGLMQVECPVGAGAGQRIKIMANGAEYEVEVPAGIIAGQTFQIEIPDAAPQSSVPIAQGVMVQPDYAQPTPQYAQPPQYAPQPQYMQPQSAYAPHPGYAPGGVQHVVVHEGPAPQFVSEPYCGPLSLLICLFVPCGFWIGCCPIDERLVRVG
mmetsp:Transcript_38092/g.122926  ORF Transcript_38092/g.122926 Transcript_38092/m.122926 type:complete len:153 (-) Transcript_38092:93-551(-)